MRSEDHDDLVERIYLARYHREDTPNNDVPFYSVEYCSSCINRLDRAVAAAFRSVERAASGATTADPASQPGPLPTEGVAGVLRKAFPDEHR